MLEFKKVEISDREWMQSIIETEGSKNVDYNFLGNFLWDAVNGYKIARIGDRLTISVIIDDIPAFCFPIGSGDLKGAIDALRKEAEALGVSLFLCGAEKKHIDQLHELGITDFRAEPFRTAFDYVYDAQLLAELPGKKYHGKRNHIHRFEEHENWLYKRMEVSDLEAVKAFNESWFAAQEPEESLEQEKKVIDRMFRYFEQLDLLAGVLYLDGEVIAYTVGERYQKDCLQVCFEKARADIQGAYPMINREFVRMAREIYPEIAFVNREDDMGIPELQKAKESYHPIFLVEKYNLYFQ